MSVSKCDQVGERVLLVFGEVGEGEAEADVLIYGGDLPAQLQPTPVGLFDGEEDEFADLCFAERVYEAAAHAQVGDARLMAA